MNLNKLQNNYYQWLSKQFKVSKIKGVNGQMIPCIITPFTNFLGDNFEIYVINHKNGLISLDDDGETINNFKASDISVKKSSILKSVKQHKIDLVDKDMLSITGKPSDFPKIEYQLLLTMMSIDKVNDPNLR